MSTATGPDFLHKDQVRSKLGFADTFRFLLIYTRGVRTQFSAYLALVFTGSFLGALAAARFGDIIQDLSDDASKIDSGKIWILAGLEVFAIVFVFFGRRGLSTTALEAIFNLRRRLFTHMKQLTMSYYDREPVGRIVTRLTHDVDVLETFYSGTLSRLLSVFLSALTVIIVMLQDTWWLGLGAALLALPSIAVVWWTRNASHELYRNFSRTSSAITARLAEFLNGLPVIRIFGLEDWSLKRFHERTEDFWKAGDRINFFNSWLRSSTLFLTHLPLIFVFISGTYLVAKDLIGIGVLVAYMRLSDRLARPAGTLMMEIHQIQSATASTERLVSLLAESAEDLGAEESTDIFRGTLSFENVSMRYAPELPRVLDDFNLQINYGEKLGIMGRTGSGKSTLISLLTRLYPLEAGSIRLNGRSIEELGLASFRKQVGFVSQNSYLLPGSVRDNLVLGAPIPDSQIWSCCDRTGFGELLRRSGRHLDTYVQGLGSNFSQGEAQLLALTRALLQDPALLILDEATANLDPELEDKVQHAIEELSRGRSSIFVAHRLRTLNRCDRVIILQNGRIVKEVRGSELKNPSAEILAHLEA